MNMVKKHFSRLMLMVLIAELSFLPSHAQVCLEKDPVKDIRLAIRKSREPKCKFNASTPISSEASENLALANWQTSPLWGQEIIGSDLATDFLSMHPQKSNVRVAIVDIFGPLEARSPTAKNASELLGPITSERSHGNQVMDLIEDPMFGGSSQVTWTQFSSADQLMRLSDSQAQIVNISMGDFSVDISEHQYDEVARFVQSGKTVVKSAGNAFPENSRYDDIPGLIRVGAMEPNGLVSPYSQNGATVMVPASGIFNSAKETFGGTSAAAPLTTASLINVMAYLPAISSDEINKLIERTSIPTFEAKLTGNKKNMLNSYKMVRIAECLSHFSTTNLNDDLVNGRPRKCFDFSADSKKAKVDGELKIRAGSCELLEKGIKKLREAFLLDPSDILAKDLAAAYRKAGYETNALFFESLTSSKAAQHQYVLRVSSDLTERESPYFAFSSFYRIESLPLIATASRLPPDNWIKKQVASEIESKAKSNSKEQKMKAATQAAAFGPSGLSILKSLLSDMDRDVSKAAAKGFRALTMHQYDSNWANATQKFIDAQGLQRKIDERLSYEISNE